MMALTNAIALPVRRPWPRTNAAGDPVPGGSSPFRNDTVLPQELFHQLRNLLFLGGVEGMDLPLVADVTPFVMAIAMCAAALAAWREIAQTSSRFRARFAASAGASRNTTVSSAINQERAATGSPTLASATIHDLRHSYASRALALGESLPMIGKLLGHSQIQTTARYAHLARDSVKEAAERIASSIAADIMGGDSRPASGS